MVVANDFTEPVGAPREPLTERGLPEGPYDTGFATQGVKSCPVLSEKLREGNTHPWIGD
jgi:hypothetical protein